MNVTFVGHASILVEAEGASILCDPWLKGRVFNDGWRQYSEPLQIDFSTIDYIWVSHEHPDHFNFPTLKSIPETERKRIRILYQKHASPRIFRAFKNLGFNEVIELPLYRWGKLDGHPQLEIYCGSVGSMDSFIAFRDPRSTLLNLNDCILNETQLEYLKGELGDIDVLFTQFSFAGWVGNESDQLGGAELKLSQMRDQQRILRPKTIVPFASFIYFSNEENARMNAWANTPALIQRIFSDQVHFMYPGDRMVNAQPTSPSMDAVGRYMRDLEAIEIDPMPESKSIDEVVAAAEKSNKFLRSKYPRWVLRRIAPMKILVHDIGGVLEVSPYDDSVKSYPEDAPSSDEIRYVMCSQVAWFMFNFTWGASTTMVAGMFRDLHFDREPRNAFFRIQNLASTEVFNFSNPRSSMRAVNFIWSKKWELAYRMLPRRVSRVLAGCVPLVGALEFLDDVGALAADFGL